VAEPASDAVYRPSAPPPALAPDPEADAHVATLRREGFVVLPEVLSSSEVAALRAALAPWLQGRFPGRNDFEGFRSERVYALLAKDPALALLVEHPRLLALVDRLLAPHYLLSACLAIQVHPGETPQGWHFDDGGCRVPRPREMCGVSAMWALDDFTEQNGATQLIPRSHLWGDDVSPTAAAANARSICMPAGSLLAFAGTLWHRGGASRGPGTRLGVTPQYCQPWLRQLENMALAVPPDAARRLSPRVQELLGYSIAEPSFMGYVDGLHPKRLIDPEYARRRRAEREAKP
jgi:ectoine hydroxylase-related dioxygenase (phytanoyl-CoA dioxygenase family)